MTHHGENSANHEETDDLDGEFIRNFPLRPGMTSHTSSVLLGGNRFVIDDKLDEFLVHFFGSLRSVRLSLVPID